MKLNYCQARDSDPSPVQLSLKLGQQLKLSILIISRVFLVHFRFFSLSCCFSRTHALKTIITEIDFIKLLFLKCSAYSTRTVEDYNKTRHSVQKVIIFKRRST